MSRHEDSLRLRHMLDYANEAVAMLGDRHFEDLRESRMLEYALTRLVEIVGEAATRVSPEGQAKYPEIPWRVAAGMRNRLAHGYDRVDLQVLFDTIKEDLPPLIRMLQSILEPGKM